MDVGVWLGLGVVVWGASLARCRLSLCAARRAYAARLIRQYLSGALRREAAPARLVLSVGLLLAGTRLCLLLVAVLRLDRRRVLDSLLLRESRSLRSRRPACRASRAQRKRDNAAQPRSSAPAAAPAAERCASAAAACAARAAARGA
mgnify:CR=1 FL=1